MRISHHYIIAFILFISISGCDQDRNKPGWSYFNDMEKSQAYETWSENPNLRNGQTMTQPLEGTVPVGVSPFVLEKSDENLAMFSKYQNPIENTPENFSRGKELYKKICISCHGEKGDGLGHLFTSKKYPYPPSSFLAERALNKNVGELYHNFSAGFGVMAAHKSMINSDDRWRLVNYIMHLQKRE